MPQRLRSGQIGPEAKEAIPALTSLLRDQDSYVRIDAAHTLEKFGELGSVSCVATARLGRKDAVAGGANT